MLLVWAEGPYRQGRYDMLLASAYLWIVLRRKSGCMRHVGGLCISEFLCLMSDICEEQRSSGVITGWRNELYPVCETFYTEPVMLIERAAAVHFGVKASLVYIPSQVVQLAIEILAVHG